MKHEGVHELFGKMAERYGEAVAMEGARGRISYGELERRSNQVGWRLLRDGVKRGSVVGLMGEDAIEMTVGILGILKAGCVFVPLDGRFPEKRLASMVEQARPEKYVVESWAREKLERVAGVERGQVLLLKEEGEEEAGEEEAGDVPSVEWEGDEGCSIYFTSGSTGKPKGILGRLKGIDHFVKWEIERLGIGEGTRVSQLASPSFDGFLKDVMVPLCAGGVVCVPEDRQVVMEGERLLEWVERAGVEVLQCVPSVWRSLLQEPLSGERLKQLKWVVLAGEMLPVADVRKWMKIFGERIGLMNFYGPTETTIIKLYHQVKAADAERPSIPIGKPLPGAAVMILNAAGQPCREGAVGEIYIRTPYCALGYYGQPELTREVFRKNPFTNDPTDIIYRTGDYGRLLEDGNVEFLGRRDQQVKVRGVRVELTEVENLLREHSGIRDVAVVDREDGEGNKVLCAYVVGKQREAVFEVGELRQFVAERLPEAMVPSLFVAVEELPRTLNGKIDRKALPEMKTVSGVGREGKVVGGAGPRTPLEEIVCGIWEEVLHRGGIGVEENFFECGGHSLLATRVMLRVRKAVGVDLPLRVLFEAPTIAGLAGKIEQALQAGSAASQLPALRAQERTGEIPLSYAQQRLWFVAQLEPENPAYNMPFAIRLRGKLEQRALERSVNQIVCRHEVLRTRFPQRQGVAVQQILAPPQLSIAVVGLEHLAAKEREEEARRLAQAEMLRSFDLAQDWLLRVKLLRLGEEDHLLLVTMHHIVSDGWSIGILVREFNQLYAAYSQGLEPALPELPIQYADFTLWQRSWLNGPLLQNQLDYWRKQLRGLKQLKLPTDRPRLDGGSRESKQEDFQIDLALTQKLNALSRREGATLFMTLVTAFDLTLARYTGQQDVAIGTDVANRTAIETEGLIGFFVNQLVLRTDLSGNPSFRELLSRVRQTIIGAYMHQDVPFEKIVDELQPERRLGENPLFDIKVVLQNAPYKELSLPGLKMEGVENSGAPPKFDILLNLVETAQGLYGSTHYNADLFLPGTIQGLLHFYQSMLATLAQQSDLLDAPQQKLISLNEQKIYSSVASAAAVSGPGVARVRQRQSIPPVRSI